MITIIIHNSMEVVQYIIYIINDDIKNTMDYYWMKLQMEAERWPVAPAAASDVWQLAGGVFFSKVACNLEFSVTFKPRMFSKFLQ